MSRYYNIQRSVDMKSFRIILADFHLRHDSLKFIKVLRKELGKVQLQILNQEKSFTLIFHIYTSQ